MYIYIYTYTYIIYTHITYRPMGYRNHFNNLHTFPSKISRNPPMFPQFLPRKSSIFSSKNQELRALHLLLQPLLQLAEVREARRKASEALERFGALAKGNVFVDENRVLQWLYHGYSNG